MPKNYISPTSIARASRCLHSWFLDCHGDASKKAEPDAGTLLMFQRGKENEKKLIASLTDVANTLWDGKDYRVGRQATLKLMKEGHQWIRGAVLLTEGGLGFPDLLRKQEGNSKLGNYTYVPIDIKGHKKVLPKDRFQLLGYAYLLEPFLGKRPTEGGIWLNTGEIEKVNLIKLKADFEDLLQSMEHIKSGKRITKGVRSGECTTCDWSDFCFSVWNGSESVCLLYGITSKTAEHFEEAGFSSWRQVAGSTPAELGDALEIKQERARII